ncbi:MAG: RNHCP domain-containing protein [Rickettsiales bacterium]|jgi:rubrerythrin|nr:RNHCP domain-containing protein [Rickettsiales bacterium]
MKTFQKRVEDFTCGNCGAAIRGDGYTNHCPECLWSKDVDINPGDRAGTCGGMMEPVGVETAADNWTIIHKCQKCGKTRRNKSAPADSTDEMIKVQKKAVDESCYSAKLQ